MSYFPVALFAYNRPQHLERTLQALAQAELADQTALYIFSDGSKFDDDVGVKAVRKLIAAYEGFLSVTVVEASENIGLAGSVIAGVSKLLKSYEAVIVLEDDVICSKQFLVYMNAALKRYQDEKSIFSVTGHMFPRRSFPLPNHYEFDTFLASRCSSWSWGVWRDRWNKVDWEMRYFETFSQDLSLQESFSEGGEDLLLTLKKQHKGEINSWAIRFCYAHFSNNAYCVYPAKTLVKNIGLDNSGMHSIPDRRYMHDRLDQNWLPRNFCSGYEINPKIQAQFKLFFEIQKSFMSKQKSIYIKILKSWDLKLHVDRQPNILFVNTYEKSGGASIAAHRIFNAVSKMVNGVRLCVLFKASQDRNVYGIELNSWRGKLAIMFSGFSKFAYLHYPSKLNTFFSTGQFINLFRLKPLRYQPNLIHLHWISDGLLSISDLKKWNCPIVWTMHDLWAATGGCHYPAACDRYLVGCGKCDQLASNELGDLSHKIFKIKKDTYSQLNLTVVSPSKWLANMAKGSQILNHVRIEVIPNGVDLQKFAPIDKNVARKSFGIANNDPIILIGSQALQDSRKGIDLFAEALKLLQFPLVLMVFGEGQTPFQESEHIRVHTLGSVVNEDELVNAYSAATVYVCPSREDNLPNTVIEALACGTPAVGFRVGGLPEIIDHQSNGWIADPFDVGQLAQGISWVINHPKYSELTHNSRQSAIDRFDVENTAKQYLKLYSELTK